METLGWMVGIAGAVAASVLWLGMMLCLLTSVRHSIAAKIGWIVLFLTINILAAVIYYVLVYTRQPAEYQIESISRP